MGEHAPVWKKGGGPKRSPPCLSHDYKRRSCSTVLIDTFGISPIPVLPPDNEKARWPIVGSVSKRDGDNEKLEIPLWTYPPLEA